MPLIVRRSATSCVSSPIVCSASVIGMPARTNTESWRVKCISSFFLTFSLVSSMLNALRRSSILTG